MIEDGVLTIVLAHLLADDGIVAAAQTGRELQVHRRTIHLIDLDGYDLLQLFDLLLHLHGLRGLIAEAFDECLHVGHLLLLVLVGTDLLLTAFCPQRHIFVVFHPVVDHLSAGDLQGAVCHIIDKGTVVTDQYHGLSRLCQELLQPLDTLDVEVVRRLVEQQHVRFLQQDLRQLDTHAPASAELMSRTFQIGAQEAQTAQCAFDLCLVVLSTHHHIPLVFLCVALHQLHIVITLIVSAFRQFPIHLVEPFLHPRITGKGLARLLPHRRIVLQVHHLRQIAYRRIVRHGHHTLRRALLSAQNLQQGTLACPVLAHQRNAVAVVHHETGISKQRLHAELNLQSFYRNHFSIV